MSHNRHRVVPALATLAALVMAVPALAGSDRSPAMSASSHVMRLPGTMAPRALPDHERPAASVGDHYHGSAIPAHYHHGNVRVYPSFGLYWGPYWGGYWDPFWYPGPWSYGWGPGPRGYALQPAVPRDQSLVEFHIKPAKATVIVDGKEIGRAKDFDTIRQPLWLKPGAHVVEIQATGYQSLRLSLDVEGGQAYTLDYALNRGQGLDNRSSEPGQAPVSPATG